MTLFIGFILSIFFLVDMDFGIAFAVKSCKRLIGREKTDGKRENMAAGMILTLAVILIVVVIVVIVLSGLELINPIVRIAGEIILFCMVLDTAKIIKIAKRAYLANTDNCDEIKKSCEAVADSLCDGVIAPVFYMALGGAWLAVLYRIVCGIHAELEKDENPGFSRFPTRLYDILDFIPSRISAVLVMCASRFLGYNYKNAIEIFWRDRMKCGYNRGQVKAVFAGALGFKFGKTEVDFGDYMSAPSIGDDIKKAEKNDIKLAMNMMYAASAIAVAAGSIVRFIFT